MEYRLNFIYFFHFFKIVIIHFCSLKVHLTLGQVDLKLNHVVQASLKLMIILSELPKSWDYMCELSKQAFFLETSSHYVAQADL